LVIPPSAMNVVATYRTVPDRQQGVTGSFKIY
jgi:hypothetical protein